MSDDQNEEIKHYVYVEPMGHGSHFVAEISPDSIIPGTVQFNVLRGDGSIDRTIGMNGNSIFRWTGVSRENALILAQQLEQQQAMYDVSVPQRLLLEAAKPNLPPSDREDTEVGYLAYDREDTEVGHLAYDREEDEDEDDIE